MKKFVFTMVEDATGMVLKQKEMSYDEAVVKYWNGVNDGFPMLTFDDIMKDWLTNHVFDNDKAVVKTTTKISEKFC